MKISVVTVVWNRHETVAESICSTQAQTWEDREHVIQDGGSTDGTLEIIRALADDRTRLESERDGGIYDAINCGIFRATGDVIGVMHSDDTFANNRVLETIANAMADPGLDGVYGDLDYVSASDPSKILRHWKAGEYHPRLLKRGWMPPHPTLYLRRDVFEKWGAYDTQYNIAADYDAMLRWLAKGGVRLAYIPEVLVKMRVGGESNSSLANIWMKSCEDYKALVRNEVGGIRTLIWKNISKIPQFLRKE